MLPLINLQSAELRSFDAPQGAAGLVPEGADALDGDFADILHVRAAVFDEDAGGSGEFLQPGGRELPLLPLPSLDTVPIVGEALTSGDKFEHIGPIPLPPASMEQAADMTASLMPGDASGETPTPIQEDVATRPLPHDVGPEPAPAIANNPLVTAPAAIADEAVPLPQPATPQQSGILSGRELRPAAAAADPVVRETSRQASLQRSSELVTSTVGLQQSVTTAPETPRTPLPIQFATPRRASEPAPPVAAETSARLPEEPLRPLPAGAAIDDAALVPRPQPVTAQHSAPVAGDPLPLIDNGQRTLTDGSSAPPRLTSAQLISAPVDLSLQDSGWDRVISERVLMMANGRLQNAEIRLTPAELGPLRIQVAIDDGTANVAFQAQHAVTREAIELAMPRLRELMAENGLTLGQANVSDDGIHQGGRDEARSGHAGKAVHAEDAEGQDAGTTSVRARVSDALVDTFA